MTNIPVEWQERILDREYLLKLWEPKFLEVKGLILLEAHYDPANLQQWLQIQGAHRKLENTINHVHLDDITSELELQRDIGESLRTRWSQALQQAFPHETFEINLVLTETGWELQLWTNKP